MIKWILALLLLAQPVLAQTSFSNLTMVNVIVKQAAGGATQTPDWTSSFVVVYDFEDPSPWNQSGGTCGSNCNLTNSGVIQDGVTYQQNTESAYFLESDGVDYAYCANGTCTAISGLTGSVSFGMWVENDNDTENGDLITSAGGGGFKAFFTQASDLLTCYVYDGTSQYRQSSGWVLSEDSGWVHVACTHDASGGAGASTISPYIDGVSSGGTKSDANPMTANTSGDPRLSSSSAVSAYTGNLDEVFIYDGALSAAAVCRICSCGIDGSLCTYSGGEFVTEGRNDDECNGCQLCSNASAETPGTCS